MNLPLQSENMTFKETDSFPNKCWDDFQAKDTSDKDEVNFMLSLRLSILTKISTPCKSSQPTTEKVVMLSNVFYWVATHVVMFIQVFSMCFTGMKPMWHVW
jgi:hypothetical protein